MFGNLWVNRGNYRSEAKVVSIDPGMVLQERPEETNAELEQRFGVRHCIPSVNR